MATNDPTASEYGQYVATSVIEVDGVRAFNPGDDVPSSTVKSLGLLDSKAVAKSGTKAADAAVDAPA